VPLPFQPIIAGCVRGAHPVLGPRHVQRVAADPRVPPPVDQPHDRVLDRRPLVTREGRAGLCGLEPGRVVGLQDLDPPALALRGPEADVQPPPALFGPDDRRPFHPLRPELGLVEGRHRSEGLPVWGAGDDRLVNTVVPVAHPVADDEAAVLVQRSTGGACPVPWPVTRSRDRDHRTPHTRQREPSHARTLGTCASAMQLALRPRSTQGDLAACVTSPLRIGSGWRPVSRSSLSFLVRSAQGRDPRIAGCRRGAVWG
jgi:hypothetical protein